jgi:hypothetical protein
MVGSVDGQLRRARPKQRRNASVSDGFLVRSE